MPLKLARGPSDKSAEAASSSGRGAGRGTHVGDERIPWREVDPTPVGIETDEVVPVDVTAPPPVGGSERIEVLRIRWDTPRGRKVRSAVIRDIRFEGSKHLSEILAELRGAGEVPKFLDLRYVRLDSENLNGTNLSGADLTGADLSKTTLVSANLRQARLVRARLVGATLRDADLSRADLSEANLTEACLDGTVQVSSVLARSRCIGASFRGASLVGADLRGAMLVRAVFERADLGGAEVGGAHALARAFETSTQRPNGIADVNEVPLSAPTVVLPRGPLDVARLE